MARVPGWWSDRRVDGAIAVSLALFVGIVHREAGSSPWADDRVLAGEPEWFQLAAPLMHAAVRGAVSIGSGLTVLLDPLTPWSWAGDVRGLAAGLAGLAGALIYLLLRFWRVPRTLAGLLATVPAAGTTLPVSIPVSPTHALHLLLASSLLFCVSIARTAGPRLVPALAALTLVGAANHASFLPFAAVAWGGVVWQRPQERGRSTGIAIATLIVALGLAAAAVELNAQPWRRAHPVLRGAVVDVPDALACAVALMAWRFPPALQPSGVSGAWSSLHAALPLPFALIVPLAICAWARREARQSLVVAAGAAVVVALWVSASWLPDASVAGAIVTASALLWTGVGLSWVAGQRVRGAGALALAAAAFAAVHGFVDRTRLAERPDAVVLQAFTAAIRPALTTGVWVSERLAVDRAFLLDPDFPPRAPAAEALLNMLPVETAPVVLPEARAVLARRGYQIRAFEASFPSAGAFIAARREGDWLVLAVHDDAQRTEALARELLEFFHADPPPMPLARMALLGYVGAGDVPAALVEGGRLDLRFGQPLGPDAPPVPARVLIETDPGARVTLNGVPIEEISRGAILVVFNPWTGDRESWMLGTTDEDAVRPAIRDPRLQPAYVLIGSAR